MSHMADKDHIAITSRDASTTRRKVSVRDARFLHPNTVTYGESSDTYRRIASDSEIAPGTHPPERLRRIRQSSSDASAGVAPWSVRHLVFRERAPPALRALVHRERELTLALGHPVDGRGDLSGRMVTA
jgi:hypothetical protein